MFEILPDGTDFRVVDQMLKPDDGSKITTDTVRLRIFRQIPGGAWTIYDWGDGTFKAGPVSPASNQYGSCTHKTVDDATYDTAIHESPSIAEAAFVIGDRYLFEFEETGNTIFHAYQMQWAGVFGDQAASSDIRATEGSIRGSIAGQCEGGSMIREVEQTIAAGASANVDKAIPAGGFARVSVDIVNEISSLSFGILARRGTEDKELAEAELTADSVTSAYLRGNPLPIPPGADTIRFPTVNSSGSPQTFRAFLSFLDGKVEF